ncbi:MAG: response regulator [Sphingobacteriia bacterium]|nr:response regulator [Sphingobacteriia bacterium]
MFIVLIDDEEAVHESVSLGLMGTGYNLKTFYNPIEGLNYLLKGQEKPELILLDLMMPEMNGVDVLIKIKEDINLKDIPVIIQTGIGNKEDINKCLHLGAHSCLHKPYSIKALLELIENALA